MYGMPCSQGTTVMSSLGPSVNQNNSLADALGSLCKGIKTLAGEALTTAEAQVLAKEGPVGITAE